MWRDRTNLFISYRQSYAHHPAAAKPRYGGSSSNGFGDNEESRGLMSAGAFDDDGDAVIEMDVLPPRWLDIQDEVTELLADIAKQTRRLDQLHNKHVLPGFDDEDVKKREEREIEAVTQEITRGFQSCQKAIKRIESMVRESRQTGNVSRGEETMATNLKVSLAARVGDASANFRKKQSNYLKKLRSLGGLSPNPLSRTSTPMGTNPYADPALSSSLQESYDDTSLSHATLLQTKQHRVHANPQNDAMIAQREREIEDIAQGIIELASIFQELQTMVIDQGSMLDRIDYNVERMTTDVKEADKELVVASGYQRKTVKRKIMLLLVLVIVGVFILLGLKLGSRGSSSAPIVVAPPPEVGEGGGSGGDTDPDGGTPPAVMDMETLEDIPIRRAASLPRRKDWAHRRKRRIWGDVGKTADFLL